MSLHTFRRRSRLQVSADAVFRWHAEPGALERLTPPWERMRVVDRTGGIENGARVTFRIGPLGLLWVAEHRDVVPGRNFRDIQVRGPFRRWEHTHRFLPDGDVASFLEDEIVYEFPLGRLGELLAGRFVRCKLARLFDYRHRLTAQALETASSQPPRLPGI